MKKIIYFITVIGMLSILSGCEDFLDSQSYINKNSETFPVTDDDVNQMVTGVYNALSVCMNNDNMACSYFLLSELAADDRFGGGGLNDKNPQAISHLMYNDPSLLNGFWTSHYIGIARANAALTALDNFEEGDLKNQKVGEVKFLRALFNFELVQILGDVPLMKAIPKDVAEAKSAPPQSTQEEIFKFIASDLWDAYSNMPSSQWNEVASGTVTKWAAAGLLARVWLFYTGFYGKDALPTEDGSVTRDQVVAALEDCMNNSGHELISDFRSLWGYTNMDTKKDYPYAQDAPNWVMDGMNSEHVFVKKMIPHSTWQTYPQCNQYLLFFALRNGNNTDYRNTFPMGQGWGFGPVNTRLWDEWVADEPNDPRRKASIYNQADEAIDYSGQWGADRQMEETGLWQKKVVATTAYGNPNSDTGLWNYFTSAPDYYNISGDDYQHGGGTDLIIIRYADILLMHSELTRTVTGMNRVRARVGLPGIAAYSDNALRNERRHELAFEGVRWGDIRRWGIAADVLPAMYGVAVHNDNLWTTMKPQGSGVADRYRQTKGFFMKPQIQIDLSGGAYTQNDGWGNDAVFNSWVDN
ncbi:MAG: RagB/SusD family nutrient uptake outer membrane protein [Candidatus Azobacteroides sp.]|nr:RagB/SusD family nutrient uptake outer membrane protein [Candidatus Azobacteroides sp.]